MEKDSGFEPLSALLLRPKRHGFDSCHTLSLSALRKKKLEIEAN